MQLRNRIREHRKSQGESLRDLAGAIGMDPGHLSKIERGERGCTDDNKMAIAAHYNVPVTELFFVQDDVAHAPVRTTRSSEKFHHLSRDAGRRAMRVYRGVIRGKTVVLNEPVDLPDDTVVEVRPAFPPPATPEERTQEEAFKRHLLEIGLIKEIRRPRPDPPGLDRTPIQITGRPLSEWIIEERR